MASTVFTDHTTLILAAWLNDVNNWTYQGISTSASLSLAATTVTWSGNPTHSGNHIFSGNVSVNGNATLGNAVGDSHTINGPLTTVVTQATLGHRIKSAAGDVLEFYPLAAGGGASIGALNNASTDFKPLALSAETITLNYRTGVGTIAAGLTLSVGGDVTVPNRVIIGNSNSGGQLLDVSGGAAPAQGYWSRFRGNVGGTLPAALTGGLFIGWNRSNAQGETELLFGTPEGTSPYLSFGSWNGTVIKEQVRITHTANAVNRLVASGSTTGNPVGLGIDGTDTNIGFDLYSKGTGSVRIRTNSSAQTQVEVAHVAGAVNYVQLSGAITAGNARVDAKGSDTNVGLSLVTQGSGAINFNTNNAAQLQFVVAHTASAVNYLQVTGRDTGNGPIISSQGTDSNINLELRSKGTGSIYFLTGGGLQATIIDVASTVNYLQLQGSPTGGPLEISAVGADTNISWVYDSKGSGTHTFRSDDGANNQFQVLRTASSSRWITVAGSNGANPTVGTSAGNIAFSATTVFLNTGLTVLDTDASHVLSIVPGSNLTANRQFTLTTGDAARTLTMSTDITLDQGVAVASSPTFAALTLSGLTANLTIGGASMVQNSQSTAYTTVASDANKHLLHPTADNNARTFTIAANASVAYAIGTAITFVNQINTMTIAINSDTLVLQGPGTTGSRTLAANGIATALKVAATVWVISGTGLT